MCAGSATLHARIFWPFRETGAPCQKSSPPQTIALRCGPMLRLVSLLGIISFLLLAWLLSNNRRLFPWRTVLWGLALQFFFALFILKTPVGVRLFAGAQTLVGQLNQSAYE